MNFSDGKKEIVRLLSRVNSKDLPRLIDWMKNSDEVDDGLIDNQKVILQSISEDLRACLPLEAVLSSESLAIQKTQQNPQPTLHVDAFLYDEDTVDTLCEEGKMSRNYCLNCGTRRTAPLDMSPIEHVWDALDGRVSLPDSVPHPDSIQQLCTAIKEFISHSFSILELQFLFQHVLPDLTGRLVVDVGSRLGAVLYGGYLYSSAVRLVGVEISAEFVRLQNMAVDKYGFSDRIQVIHGDISTQDSLLQNADVLIMNNVFEYFLQPNDQIKAWYFIVHNFRKKGALLVTVPSLQEALSSHQGGINLSKWVEELPLDYNVYLGKDGDPDAFKNIHLYRVL
nr:uncharacterized protein LOC115139017 isoform X2 [Oncorhynchus nerka]